MWILPHREAAPQEPRPSLHLAGVSVRLAGLPPEPVWGGLQRWVWHGKGMGAPLPTEQSCSEGSLTLGQLRAVCTMVLE